MGRHGLLSQRALDRLARVSKRVYGTLLEWIDYDVTTAAGVVIATHEVQVYMSPWSGGQLSTPEILPGDYRVRSAVEDMPWTPSLCDTFVRRKDTTRWKVISPTGGPGTAWWVLQARQVG